MIMQGLDHHMYNAILTVTSLWDLKGKELLLESMRYNNTKVILHSSLDHAGDHE